MVVGGVTTLARYQQSRRFDSHLMLVLTDGINRLFFNDLPGDVRIYVSVGSGVLPVVHDNRKKEYPDATANRDD